MNWEVEPIASFDLQRKWGGTNDGYARDRTPCFHQHGQLLGTAIVQAARAAAEAAAETIWTTRCIICDKPGDTLCGACRLRLPYIDRNLACPRCGSPHGRGQCMDCNAYSLSEVGRSTPPFERCVSAIEHRGAAQLVITGYKDAGERRLARDIGGILADTIPHAWVTADAAITFVPSDRRARRKRGFDHMAKVADELAEALGMPCLPMLEKLPVSDQRGLTRAQRFANMAGAVRTSPGMPAKAPGHVILVDDVYTTGATLFAASDALLEAGIPRVFCATFARVP